MIYTFPPVVIIGLVSAVSFAAFFLSQKYVTIPGAYASPAAEINTQGAPFGIRQHPDLRFCRENPVLRRLNRTRLVELERNDWRKWDASSLDRVINMSLDLGQGLGYFLRTRGALWDNNNHCGAGVAGVNEGIRMLAPIDYPLPCPSPMKVYGKSKAQGDTGKLLCEAEEVLKDPSSVVYSLGSNNQFEFEEAILHQFPNTHIFTFDCTSAPPQPPVERLKFEKSCLGGEDSIIAGLQFHTLRYLMESNGHRSVTLLKMDIEGAEFFVFQGILKNPLDPGLPYQISFETHFWNVWAFPVLHVALFEQLHFAGYRIVSREMNAQCPNHNEFTVVRVYC